MGAGGVRRAVEVPREELELAMALTGRASMGEIDESALWRTGGRTGGR